MRNLLHTYNHLFIVLSAITVGAGVALGDDTGPGASVTTVARSPAVYDCAANTVFLACRALDLEVTYEQCMQLLPISRGGNSMLEIKNALTHLGVVPIPVRVTLSDLVGLRVPAIIWTYPPDDAFVRKESDRRVGHFMLVIPMGHERVQIVDYPSAPTIVPVRVWERHLQAAGIEGTLIIMCGLKGQKTQDMLSHSGSFEGVGDHRSMDGVGVDVDYVINADNSQDAVASWDFGDVSEGSVVKHNFAILNGGIRELHISRVSKDCTCSVITTDRESIPSWGRLYGDDVRFSGRKDRKCEYGRRNSVR